MATKVKSAKKYRKEITKSVGVIHDEIINISDELVDGTITAAAKWQKLWAKAIKNSQPMVSKQMDIMYDTLHSFKGQLKVSGKRIKGLVNDELDLPTAKTAKKAVRKTVAKAAKKVTAKRKATTKTAKKVVKAAAKTTAKRKATTKKSTKAVKASVKRNTKPATRRKAVKADNLQLIEGIGPKLESILKKNGIKTFKSLSTTKVATLRSILEKAGPRFNAQNPSTWSKQARFAAAGKFSDLIKFQAKLNKK